MAKEVHPIINHAVISRNGEWFNRNRGFGFFDPALQNRKPDINLVPEKTHWLIEETEALYGAITHSPDSLLVTGDLGDGKSALIYGLRATYRKNNQPYAYIDGHFQEADPKGVILWAQKNKAPIFWDSLDYLIIQSKKMRKYSLPAHQERSIRALDEIHMYISEGGKIIGTSHTEAWISSYCDTSFTNGRWEELQNRISHYRVNGVLKPNEILDFYETAKFSQSMAIALSALATQEGLQKSRRYIQSNGELAQYETELIAGISKYKTAKLLALAADIESGEMRKIVKLFSEDQITEEIFLENLFKYILFENRMTLKKNGTLRE